MKNIPKEIGEYVFDRSIGFGTYAKVFLAHQKVTQTNVAIKIFDKMTFDEEQFTKEVDIIRNLDHPFIAQYFESLSDDNYYYIVMEYVQNGSLLDFINQKGAMSESIARHYFCQLVSVIEYLHVQMKVCHRDLKPENVLLDRHNNIRLIDFGLSKEFSGNENQLMSTICGSSAYCSPEMLNGNKYSASSDIWSVGIILYSMVVGELPFVDSNVQRLLQKIVYTEPKYPNKLSQQLRDLMRRMLQKQPDNRISLERIKFHPWFSQYQYSKMMNKNFGSTINGKIYDRDDNDNTILDREIIQKLGNYGIDCSDMASMMLLRNSDNNNRLKVNSAMTVYKILKKEKITDEIAEVVIFCQTDKVITPKRSQSKPPLNIPHDPNRRPQFSVRGRPNADNSGVCIGTPSPRSTSAIQKQKISMKTTATTNSNEKRSKRNETASEQTPRKKIRSLNISVI